MLRTVIRPAAAIGALSLLGSHVALAQDTARLIDYYRRKQNIGPEVNVTASSPTDAKIPGAKSVTIEAGGQKTTAVVSPDGRYVVFGEVEDITVDPFKAIAAKINTKDQPVRGGKDAKVTIVEYSDFQCPFCARAHATLANDVLKAYGDKVRLIHKHFPLNFHKWAEPISIAGECVFQQDKDAYWKFYDYMFEHQGELNAKLLTGQDVNWDAVKEVTLESVKGSKVNDKKLAECVDGKKTADLVRGDMAEGQSLGVTGTPAFLINGRKLVGAQPADKFKAIIDDELKRN